MANENNNNIENNDKPVKKGRKIRKAKKNSKDKKKSDPISTVVIVGFSAIFVIFVVLTLFALNVLNIKSIVKERIVHSLLTEQLAIEVEKIKEEYDQKFDDEFKKENERLSQMEKVLISRDEELKAKEEEISKEKAIIDETLSNIKQKEKEIYGLKENIDELCDIVESMTPSSAAAFILKMEKEEQQNVIFNLKKDVAAQILEQIDPRIAAEIASGRFNGGVSEENIENPE